MNDKWGITLLSPDFKNVIDDFRYADGNNYLSESIKYFNLCKTLSF